MKRPKSRRGKDKYARLVCPDRVPIGLKVWWQHVHYWRGVPTTYWRMGVVEVKQQRRWVIVRDSYGHEVRVGVKELRVPET